MLRLTALFLALGWGATSSDALGQRPVPATGREPAVVASFKEGRLTLRAQDQTVERVFDRLLQVTGIAVIPSNEMTNARISVHLINVPLEDGLRQLLKNHDAFFFYGAEKDSPARLRLVWVYPKGRGRNVRPVPPETWASTKEIEGRLNDPDPEVRYRAIEEVVQREGTAAREVVMRALTEDSDEKVRTRALYAAQNKGLEIPAEVLMNLLVDPSENVRFLALEGLANNPNASAIAQLALNDPSPHVQNKAKEILQQLEVAAGRGRPTQPAQQQQQRRVR